MTKPRILIIENSIDVTGALKSITRTVYDLKDQFDFQFVIPKGSKGRFWIEKKGFNSVYELPMRELSRRPISILTYVPSLLINAIRLKRIIKKEGIALIHVNDLYNLLPVALTLFGSRVPYICHIRFLPNRFPVWLLNFWMYLHFKYSFKIIAVSKSVINQLRTHPKIVLVYNELPIEELYPPLISPGLELKHHTFLYLSNYMSGKGQNFAIEAFFKIRSIIPNWRLRFVGSDMGMEKNRVFKGFLKERAEELGIMDNIDILGFTEDVEKEYKNADIVLNFSESESFSITCVEALYFGRTVIATKCGGPEEIIDHEETGLLVANKDINEMANAMLALATNSTRRLVMQDLGRKRVRERFNIENNAYMQLNIYKSAIGR